MNILFYLYQFPAFGGIESVTALLAAEFSRRGHQVTIHAHRAKPGANLLDRLPDNVRCCYMPEDARLVSRATRASLAKTIAERGIELVIFQDCYARIEGNLLPHRGSLRIVTCEHSSPFYAHHRRHATTMNLRELIGRIKYPLERMRLYRLDRQRRVRLYNASDFYVLLSRRQFGEFRSVTRLWDTRKLRAISNPIGAVEKDVGAVAPASKDKTVLFCGTLTYLKGCDHLLKAWTRLAPDFADWRLSVVGDGEERGSLEQYAATHGLCRVTFEGYQQQVRRCYDRASIFAFPSRREGWGIVLVEAMRSGCVPVCFESYSAVGDIVDDCENGFLIPAFDERAFEARLRQLMADPVLRGNMAAHARRKAETFCVDRVLSSWEKLIDELREKHA
jgi:glycosyltransferase involved in cell wall biosynthesis